MKKNVLVGALVTAFAVIIVFIWGRKGLGVFDMSFCIDAAFRLLHGQRMYVDFGNIGHGPVTYYLSALFLNLFGVRFMSFLAHAAVVNGIAAGTVYFYFARRLKQPWPLLLGILTAIWFYGLVAWPFVEKLSFLALLFTAILWFDMWDRTRSTAFKLLIIGALTAFPLWDKQNVALVSTAVNCTLCIIYLWRLRSPLLFMWFAAGYVAVCGGLFLFFYLNGLEASVYEYFIRPASFGRFNMLMYLPRIIINMNLPLLIIELPILITLVFGGYVLRRTFFQPDGQIKWRGIVFVGFVLLQVLNANLNNASTVNDLPLIALLVGWFVLLMRDDGKHPIFVAVAAAYLLFGIQLGMTRMSWVPWAWSPNDVFSRVDQRFFSGTLIQEPEAKEIEDILDRIKTLLEPGKEFWVFPSYAALYSAMDTVSTAPILSWEARTMLTSKLRSRDENKTIEWLRRTRPSLFVFQRKISVRQADVLHDLRLLLKWLPELKKYMLANYELVDQTGAFEIYRLKTGG